MRSTGEVMGIDTTFGLAFAKSQLAAGDRLPDERAACSCRSPTATRPSASRRRAGSSRRASRIAATAGTADALEADGIPVAHAGRQGGRAHRHRRRGADLVRQGRPRRQQPARSRRPRRRRPHPRRGGRARRSRASRPRPPGWPPPTASSTAPPTSSRVRTLQEFHARHRPRPPARCRSTDDRRRRRGVDLDRPRSGRSTLPNPVLTASGTSGHGAELAPYVDLGVARRGRGEVAVRRAVGGQPAAAGARDRRAG